jgi:hypothetical protein
MKIEIKCRFDGIVLFAHETDGNTLRITVESAVNACANLTGANLAGANLEGANLTGANLTGANLEGANLTGTNLTSAYLAGAYLEGANLTGANLTGANLEGAYLAGTYLAGAKDVIDAGTPNGWHVVGWLRDGYLSVRVGCRDKRLSEGREYWANKADRTEVLAALDYVERVALLRGWKTEAA